MMCCGLWQTFSHRVEGPELGTAYVRLDGVQALLWR